MTSDGDWSMDNVFGWYRPTMKQVVKRKEMGGALIGNENKKRSNDSDCNIGNEENIGEYSLNKSHGHFTRDSPLGKDLVLESKSKIAPGFSLRCDLKYPIQESMSVKSHSFGSK
ncbi:hypothetical protein DFA_07181 [Cavenderia fasciculata]|uniref:Uncharacterized protein n=1 Tax=Cavenderia fasciculata TaxID=261658 RepID=F4PVQ0_CACFS|nr:uncharacterized protein DFA_07181 [Cavenderia fasciculata]EGG20064.1 hypothetical protein DFA_07181 [Cavenderia fasciculata]|eukprot:XP_004367047.1 hypothetical protein DFA_07181 [Cavenderia fasciculata]